ncbi:MAG: chitobiase/beta-hexosaminidase C-terminal domain-containing protein, partial [Bacteroidales bacterium]|nr:chitobiase/beta-hexosaminidase C-terminal domain-containing protein [Bacteroidales bacterium]
APEAPTFVPEAGEVAFGTMVELECETAGATIYFTVDGTEPTAESEEYSFFSEILITKAMTVKAIAVWNGHSSAVVEAAYTVAPVENAVLTLAPMKDDTVGMNVSTALSFSDGTPESENWIQQFPATVYYTVDGVTVPSKAAYDAQADKANGAIKMLSVKWEEQWGSFGPVADAEGNLMSITFNKATRLKAIGYLMEKEGDEVLVTTALLDTMLQIKSEAKPTFSIANYTKVEAGDKLVIENPNYYAEFDMEMPEWPEDYFTNEEAKAAYDEAMDAFDEAQAAYAESIADIPQTELYYSFDGTLPTRAARWEDENESVFSAEAGRNVEITFGQDEEGYYAYVPEILGYNSPADTIRLDADGKISVQVLAITTVTESGDDDDPYMPMSAKWGRPGGAAPFLYASDFVTRNYTMNEDFPAVALTFNPASGSEVEENTAVTITANQDVEIFYMMFESEEAAKAAAWDQEKALSYSAEMKPVPTKEKNTIKAAYAREGADAVDATFYYATYTVKELPAIELTFNPASGSKVKAGTTVTVTASRETEIFYGVYASKE